MEKAGQKIKFGFVFLLAGLVHWNTYAGNVIRCGSSSLNYNVKIDISNSQMCICVMHQWEAKF
jgi:hypothetical protein